MKQFFFTLIASLFLLSTNAQNDAHYGSTQFGLKGMLLSGALVAGDEDASMIFYNPAAIGYNKKKSLDISLFVPNFEITNLKNNFGVSTKHKATDFQMIPNFLSFNLSLIKNPKVGMSSSVLYKENFDNALRYNSIIENSQDILTSDIQYSYEKREIWIGLGISYELRPKFYIGMSQFMTFRTLSYSNQLSQTIVSKANPNEINSFFESSFNADIKNHIGLLNKIGFSYKGSWLNWGLTFTTPTYGYPIRKASYQYKKYLKLSDADPLTGVAYTRDKEKAKLKTPYSLATGFTFKIKDRAVLSLSSEYFGKVGLYSIISKEEENDVFTVKEAKKPVVNFAVGWQFKISEKVSYLGGFRTDFNNSELLENINVTTQLLASSWDIYHVSNGLNLKFKKNKITAGLEYGFSFDELEKPYIDADVSVFNRNLNNSTIENVKVNYHSFTFLLTYGFLLDNIKKDAK